MKRNLLLIILVSCFSCVQAQLITKKAINLYTNNTNFKEDVLAKVSEQGLNDNGELVLTTIQEYAGQSKTELYQKIKSWVQKLSVSEKIDNLNIDDANCKISFRFGIPNVAKRTMGDNKYVVSIVPYLSFDFKEGRVRFQYTLQSYQVIKTNDDSGYVLMMGNIGYTGSGKTKDNQLWYLSECVPFADKHPTVTSTRAITNSYACYQIIWDKADDALRAKAQSSDDDW